MMQVARNGSLCAVGSLRAALSKCGLDTMMRSGAKRIAVGPLQIQVATMKATHGEKYPYAKPWPYKTKPFTIFNEPFDYTNDRMCENSKIITVEGNVGVGKEEFAKRLAKEFDLAFMPNTPESDIFVHQESGVDFRLFDDLLPEDVKHYDLKRFLTDPHPELGLVGRLQVNWYRARFYDYLDAVIHLLNTGQGVVMVRSAFSDFVFTEAFKKLGWVTRQFCQYYSDTRANTICELPSPHLSIYLDAPIDVIKQRLAKKNEPLVSGAKNLTDDFLKAVDQMYKDKVLPSLRQSGEVIEIDWAEVADDMDMDVIAEEIALLKLEGEDNEDRRFKAWYKMPEEDMCIMRRNFQVKSQWEELFNLPIPWDCAELIPSQDSAEFYRKHVLMHPAIRYRKGWAPELGHDTLFRL